MRITIAAVGRLRPSPERDLFERYARLVRWDLRVREVEERQPVPSDRHRAREGEKLLACCPARAVVVALDEDGIQMTSEALARRIGAWQDEGVRDLAFLIGGAEGLDEAVRRRADCVLSFGPLTWPHLLMRGLVAEQLYRAQQILAGHPYHRG